MDPENEDQLQRAMEALTREKTVLMIAHRLKTVRGADQILVLDQGSVVQKYPRRTDPAGGHLPEFRLRANGVQPLDTLIEKDNAAVWVFYYLRRSCLITEYSDF